MAGEGEEEENAEVAAVTAVKISVSSSAEAVRQYCAGQQEEDQDHKPSRNVDKQTGALQIFASTEVLLQWVPKFDGGLCATWSSVPIFRARLFRNREAYRQGGLERCYVEQTFPEGEDLVTAIIWWRKRVRECARGFAVFEGGFDTSGLVHLTEPPRCTVDAESGEVEADTEEEVERKLGLHNKRRGMDARWAKKGISAEVRAKIASAEGTAQERKRRGEEYALRGGWVPAHPVSAAGAEESAQQRLDVAKHNEYQKQCGCK